MLTGERPYSGKDLNDLNQRVQTSEYAIPRNMLVSPSLIKFLNSCLRIDSKKRLGWEELRQHEFLQKRATQQHKLETTVRIDPNMSVNFREIYEREMRPKIRERLHQKQ